MGAGIPGSGSVFGRGVFHHHIRGPAPTLGVPHGEPGIEQGFRRNLENVTCFKVSDTSMVMIPVHLQSPDWGFMPGKTKSTDDDSRYRQKSDCTLKSFG